MDIGPPERTIEVEPVSVPLPASEPVPTDVPVPELVPADPEQADPAR